MVRIHHTTHSYQFTTKILNIEFILIRDASSVHPHQGRWPILSCKFSTCRAFVYLAFTRWLLEMSRHADFLAEACGRADGQFPVRYE